MWRQKNKIQAVDNSHATTNKGPSSQGYVDVDVYPEGHDEGPPDSPTSIGKYHSKNARAINNFTQQKLHAWQPIVTPRVAIVFLLAVAIVFFALGIVLLEFSNQVIECRKEYTSAALNETIQIQIGPEDCTDTGITELAGDVYLFYELTKFYQNHRMYVRSKSDSQLAGTVFTDTSDVTSCAPESSREGKILHPCGLIATSVFLDKYALFDGASGKSIGLDESQSTICWDDDIGTLYKNPTSSEMQNNIATVEFWLWEPEYQNLFNMNQENGVGVENSHFIVWMKNAALPDFRKLYAKLRTNVNQNALAFPVVVEIVNSFPVSHGGTKSVVLSQTSWTGGRNPFLGIAYIFVGSICFICGTVFLLLQVRSPRRVGDVKWLNRAL